MNIYLHTNYLNLNHNSSLFTLNYLLITNKKFRIQCSGNCASSLCSLLPPCRWRMPKRRRFLADSTNRKNEKIWLVLFDAVRKQYEAVNEKMYLKQSADTAKLFAVTYRMFGVLEGLDSVDAKPDRKGRVKLVYRKRHAEYLNAFRPNLYNAAVFHTGKKEYQKAFDYFAAYIDCASQPLFSDYKYCSTDKLLPRAAFYALFNGYKTKSAEQTLRYAPIALKDTAKLEMTYQYLAETYRAQNDTLKCLDVLQKGFERYPQTSYFFSHLFDYYFRTGDMKRAVDL